MIRRPGLPMSAKRCGVGRKTTYANNKRPSEAATPSSAFSNPLKLRVLTSDSWSVFRGRRDEVLLVCSATFSSDLPSGLPVALPSREVLRVKAASKSSSRTIHRAGTRPMSVVSVLSLIHDDDSDTT